MGERELWRFTDVFIHHTEEILRSRLLLDEDYQLLTTYWDPYVYEDRAGKSGWLMPACCCILAAGLAWKKLNGESLLMLTVPPAVYVAQHVQYGVRSKRYKRNFEQLIAELSGMYELNCQILSYYTKREACGSSAEVGLRLLMSVEGFLKYYLNSSIGLLETVHEAMKEISVAVPILDGERIYCLRLDLKEYSETFRDATELLRELTRLNEYYVLLVSNFLGCIALSMCKKLWKNETSNVLIVCTKSVPKVLKTLKDVRKEVKHRFDRMRYTLEIKVFPNKQAAKASWRFRKPLIDLMDRLHVVFELLKRVQEDIEDVDDVKDCTVRLAPVLHDICSNFSLCETDLAAFVNFVGIVGRQNFPGSVNVKEARLLSASNHSLQEIHHDDSESVQEDEEFSLSIHGSDTEDETKFADGCDDLDGLANHHIESMLNELRDKLTQRIKKSGNRKAYIKLEDLLEMKNRKDWTSENCVTELAQPPAPALPNFSLSQSPSETVDFLDKIKQIAERLDRPEDTYS